MTVLRITASEIPSISWESNLEVVITDTGGSNVNLGDIKERVQNLRHIRLVCEASEPPWLNNYQDLLQTTVADDWKEVNPSDPAGAAQSGSNLWWLSTYNFPNWVIPDSLTRVAEMYDESNIHTKWYDDKLNRKKYVWDGAVMNFTDLPGGVNETIPNKYGQWSGGNWGGGNGLFIYSEGNPHTYYSALYTCRRDWLFDFEDCQYVRLENFRFRYGGGLITSDAIAEDVNDYRVFDVECEHCNDPVGFTGGTQPRDSGSSKFYVGDVEIARIRGRYLAKGLCTAAGNWLKDVDVSQLDAYMSGLTNQSQCLVYMGNCAVPDGGPRIKIHDSKARYHAGGAHDNPSDGPIGVYFDSNDYDRNNASGQAYLHGIHCDTWNLDLAHARRGFINNCGQQDWRVWNVVLDDVAEVVSWGDAGGSGNTTMELANITMRRAEGTKWWGHTNDTETRLGRVNQNMSGIAAGSIVLRNIAVEDSNDATHVGFLDRSTSSTDADLSLLDLDATVYLHRTARPFANNNSTPFDVDPTITNVDPTVGNDPIALLYPHKHSPLENAGATRTYRTHDLRGNPVSSTPTIGAYEMVPGIAYHARLTR